MEICLFYVWDVDLSLSVFPGVEKVIVGIG
jgi:hypothetical protein